MRTLMLALALVAAAGQEKEGLDLSIKADRTVYRPDDELELQVRLFNTTDAEKKVTLHHDLARSIFVRQGTSLLKLKGERCACGTFEAGAVAVTVKPGESQTCTVKAFLLGNLGDHEIQVDGENLRPVRGLKSNILKITVRKFVD